MLFSVVFRGRYNVSISSGADPGFQKGGWMADHIYWREVRGFLLGNWTMPTMSKDFR